MAPLSSWGWRLAGGKHRGTEGGRAGGAGRAGALFPGQVPQDGPKGKEGRSVQPRVSLGKREG